MHWLMRDVITTAQEYWLVAQGVPSFLWDKWKRPGLFSPVPHRCQICGVPWRPDRDPYIMVMGEIVKTAFGYKWYCKQLGLVRNTGSLGAHPRRVCRDCGEGLFTKVVDCVSGETVTMRTRKTGLLKFLYRSLADIKYWPLTVFKFADLYFQIWANFARQPIHYIRCRKKAFSISTE